MDIRPMNRLSVVMLMLISSLQLVSQEEVRQIMKIVSRRSFRRAMTQANRARVDMENCQFKSPVFFVSGGNESQTMHQSHKDLAGKVPGSGYAWYPGKGHAWMVSDAATHIQLVRYWLLNSTFPESLVLNPLQ